MNTTPLPVLSIIFGLVIVVLLIKAGTGLFVGKDQKGIHGDTARTIVKKARGKDNKTVRGRARRFLFGP